MTEILFYHLEQLPLERVLPQLLEKTLERGWKAIVEVGSAERVNFLDDALWTWQDEAFLPHAIADGQTDADQPILLTMAEDNPNGADVRFFVDRALPRDGGDYARLVFMFDGHDPEAVEAARGAWKTLKPDNDCTYWQQEPSGKWTKKA